MKLRYLHLQNFPPLENVEIIFQQSDVLVNPLAVHFVAGVNGTGKTSLLQAVTQTLIALARAQAELPFPVTLAYDLGNSEKRTILLVVSPEKDNQTVLVEFQSILPLDTDWIQLADQCLDFDAGAFPYLITRRYAKGDFPGAGSIEAYLPSVLMVYTSGSSVSWKELFSTRAEFENGDYTNPEILENVLERPLGWDAWKEFEFQRTIDKDSKPPKQTGIFDSGLTTQRFGVFMTNEQIKLAVCALALYESIRSIKQQTSEKQSLEMEHIRLKYPDKGFRTLLEEIDWAELISLNLTINFFPDKITRTHSVPLYDLFLIASRVRREPEPGTQRLLSFDLKSVFPANTGFKTPDLETITLTIEALYQILGGSSATAYSVFQKLYEWQQSGFLVDISFVLRKKKVPETILYDWLSDGERMFLGRFALIYLLQDDNDALIIFDEPETHFNDVWKRRLMEFVYRSLGQRNSEVLISTHSSIVLTDVPSSQIILFVKGENGQTEVVDLRNPTFGADPSDFMISVLGTEQASGTFSVGLLQDALQRRDPEELRRLLDEVSPGYWRFRIRDVLNQIDAASH